MGGPLKIMGMCKEYEKATISGCPLCLLQCRSYTRVKEGLTEVISTKNQEV
jgi:hypothetical protein